MVKVFIKKNLDNYVYLEISGHAMQGKFGNDIVCAAVSVLGQTLSNALEEIAGISERDLDLKIDSGLLALSVPEHADNQIVNILFRNFVIGIEGIVGGYPKNVQLIIEEVQGDDESF